MIIWEVLLNEHSRLLEEKGKINEPLFCKELIAGYDDKKDKAGAYRRNCYPA